MSLGEINVSVNGRGLTKGINDELSPAFAQRGTRTTCVRPARAWTSGV